MGLPLPRLPLLSPQLVCEAAAQLPPQSSSRRLCGYVWLDIMTYAVSGAELLLISLGLRMHGPSGVYPSNGTIFPRVGGANDTLVPDADGIHYLLRLTPSFPGRHRIATLLPHYHQLKVEKRCGNAYEAIIKS